MKKKLLILFLLISTVLLFPKEVMADCPAGCTKRIAGCAPPCDDCVRCQPTPTLSYEISNPVLPESLSSMEGGTFLQKFLNVAITLILIIGSLYFFFTLLLGGIGWISTGGDKVKIENSQKQITNAFVGLAILFSAFAIIKVIEYLFGVDILKITLPTI